MSPSSKPVIKNFFLSDFDHLESGHEEPLGRPDGEEHLDPGHPVGGDGQQALGVEAGQHDGAPAQAVGQPAEGEAAYEEAGEVGQGENWEEVGSFAHEGPLCHDGSLVRGGVEELVASVAGNHPMGMVGGVSPHLKKRCNSGFHFDPDLALLSGGEEERLSVRRSRHLALVIIMWMMLKVVMTMILTMMRLMLSNSRYLAVVIHW